jgi:hypothetical protein
VKVQISDKLSLPIEVLTSTVGILGIRGSGKTNTAGVIVEEATRLGIPASVADPTGAWWGIKSSADGKSEGQPFYVFGGEHADVPLEPETGEIMARFAIERRVPMVLDLNLMAKGKQLHFMAAYAAALYHGNREPFLQVIDETARFAPQTIRGNDFDASKCLGAVEDLGALGRVKGLGLVIVGQRAAKINKDVLTQCHTLIVHQTNSPQDKKSIEDWIGEQYGKGPERERFIAELPRLGRGEAFVWSPSFDIFARVQIRARKTFDSSKTPEIGKQFVGPKVFAKVDLEQLSAELSEAKQRAIDDDPKTLRAKIRALTTRCEQLGEELAARPASEVMRVEVPVLLPAVAERMRELADTIGAALEIYATTEPRNLRTDAPQTFDNPANREKPRKPAETRAVPRHDGATPSFRAGGLRMLKACAQFQNRGLTRSQLVALAGVKAGGTFSTYINELLRAGYVEELNGRVYVTEPGLEYLGTDVPHRPRTAEEILKRWRGEFRAGGQRMLDIIVAAYPASVSRADLAEQSGIAAGGTFSTYLNELKRAELVNESRDGLYAVVLDLVAP